MAETWLVAHDFSPCAEAAARQAAADAHGLGARLYVLHVVRPIHAPGGVDWFGGANALAPLETMTEEMRAESRAGLEEVARELREGWPGLEIEAIHRDGEPADTIIEAAEELGVDRIVVGSHGKKGLERLLLGSVAEVVVRKAPMPVLVVKARAEGD